MRGRQQEDQREGVRRDDEQRDDGERQQGGRRSGELLGGRDGTARDEAGTCDEPAEADEDGHGDERDDRPVGPGELVSGSASAGAAGQKPSSAKSRKTAAVQSQKPARLR